MQVTKRERGSREARLATVRLGLFAISVFFIGALVALMLVMYRGISFFNSEVDESTYSFGDYLGAVGPIVGLASLITIVAAFALYFAYVRLLDRMGNNE